MRGGWLPVASVLVRSGGKWPSVVLRGAQKDAIASFLARWVLRFPMLSGRCEISISSFGDLDRRLRLCDD